MSNRRESEKVGDCRYVISNWGAMQRSWLTEGRGKDRCVWGSVRLPMCIGKQTHGILCQQHRTTLRKKWQISFPRSLSLLSLSPTHKHWHTPLLSLNAFLSAFEQPVRQATGKIMLFSLLGESFEMCYIINIWLEDVTLSSAHTSSIPPDGAHAAYAGWAPSYAYMLRFIHRISQTGRTSLCTWLL